MVASAQDLQFLEQAAFLNSQEIADGLLASQLSPSFAVSQFGVQEVIDHVSLNSLLGPIVTLEGLPAPQELSALFQTQINSFESAFGPSSDTQYLNTAVAGHQQSLLIYQTEALNGADPLLRSYAQGSVATIQGHLNQASSLLASSGSFRCE
jgi:putative membrane protein